MATACFPSPVWDDPMYLFAGWDYGVVSLAIDISHLRHGAAVDQRKLALHIATVKELHEALIKGKEAENSADFSDQEIRAAKLYRLWLSRNRRYPILYERTAAQIIEMLDRFDQLDGQQLDWLEQYLNAVADILS